MVNGVYFFCMSRPVTIVVPTLDVGGAERIALNLANWFSSQGMEVSLINLAGRRGLWDKIEGSIAYIPQKFNKVQHSIFWLRAFIRRNPEDFFISFMTHTNLAMTLSALFIPGFQRKICIVEVGHQSTWTTHGKGFQRVLKLLVFLLYPLVGQIVCVSHSVRQEIQAFIPSAKTVVIKNPIDIDKVRQESGKSVSQVVAHWESLPDRFNESGKLRLCCVGRLEFVKGFDILIDACRFLKDWNIDFELDIIGTGSKENWLRQLVEHYELPQSKIRFRGFMSVPWVELSQADILVIPSRSEGASMVAIEALSVGVRVVGSNTGGIPESLDNGSLGTLVHDSSAEAFASSILSEASIHRCYLEVEQHIATYNRDVIGKQYLRLGEL